jgi:hypothetical protein
MACGSCRRPVSVLASGPEPVSVIHRSGLRSQPHPSVQQRSSSCGRGVAFGCRARAIRRPVTAGATQSYRGSVDARNLGGCPIRHDCGDPVCADAYGYSTRDRRAVRRAGGGCTTPVPYLEARARADDRRSRRHGHFPDRHGVERHTDPRQWRIHDVPSHLGQRLAHPARLGSCSGDCAHALRFSYRGVPADPPTGDPEPR